MLISSLTWITSSGGPGWLSVIVIGAAGGSITSGLMPFARKHRHYR